MNFYLFKEIGDIADILLVFFTGAAVFVAIFQDWIKNWLFKRKAVIEIHNKKGEKTKYNNNESDDYYVYYYHLRVRNKSLFGQLKHCYVNLIAYEIYEDNKWHMTYQYVPPKFVWSPREDNVITQNVTTYAVFDFMRIENDPNQQYPRVEPLLQSYPTLFNGCILARSKAKYYLKVEAEMLRESEIYVFQVSWDGEISKKRDQMQKHLQIKYIGTRKEKDINKSFDV